MVKGASSRIGIRTTTTTTTTTTLAQSQATEAAAWTDLEVLSVLWALPPDATHAVRMAAARTLCGVLRMVGLLVQTYEH